MDLKLFSINLWTYILQPRLTGIVIFLLHQYKSHMNEQKCICFTLLAGGYPYPSVSNHELFSYLQEGKRLERPENCTVDVYDLMLQCWREDPNERPSFQQISKHLQPHKKIYIDFNEIEPTYVFPPTSDQIRLAIANNKWDHCVHRKPQQRK